MTSVAGTGPAPITGGVRRAAWLPSIGLAGIAAVVYAASLDFRTSGDSLVYAETIARARFDYVAVHFGYYVLIWPLYRLAAVFAPIPVEDLLVYANVGFAAAALWVGFWLARDLLGSTRLAVYSMLVLAISGRFFANATSAEMYAPQMFFLFASFLLFSRGRPLLSGLAAVVSLLITPLSVFSFLVFPVLAGRQRPAAVRRLALCAASVAAGYGLFLVFFHDALFWGERGLLKVAGSVPWEFVTGSVNAVSDTTKFFLPFLPLLALGLAALAGRRDVLLLVAAACLPHLYLVFKQPRADQLLCPTDFFLACVCGLGVGTSERLPKLGRWAGIALLAGGVLLSGYLQGAFGGPRNRTYRDDMRALHEHLLSAQNPVVVMSWWDGVALRYYNKDKTPAGRQALPEGSVYDAAWLGSRRPFPPHSEVFVLESYEPSRVSSLLLSPGALARRFEATSVRRRVEKVLKVRCEPDPIGSLETYACR